MPTFTFSGLKGAAFPGSPHPEALVHVPQSFRPDRFGLVVYLHGFDNCIENVASGPPGIHNPPHPTANLIAQLEESQKSALLFLPETGYHVRSTDPGQLGEPDGFVRLWQEVHARLAAEHPELAGVDFDAISHTVLISHSGGYKAAAQIARHGGLPIQELCLLDSLYGALELYEEIARGHVSAHASGQRRQRFVNLYRAGETGKNAQTLLERLRSLLEEHELPEALLHVQDSDEPAPAGEETGDPALDAALTHPLVMRRVRTPHSDFGRTYVGALLRTSHLPD